MVTDASLLSPCAGMTLPAWGDFFAAMEHSAMPDGEASREGNLRVTKILHLRKRDVTTWPDTMGTTISEDANQ